jgi:histone H3/H4
MADLRLKAREILESTTDKEVNDDAVDKLTEFMEEYCKDVAKKSDELTQSIKKKEIDGKDIEAAVKTKTSKFQI